MAAKPPTAALGVNGYIKASGFITGTTTLDIAETYPVDPQCEAAGNCPQTGDVVCSAEDSSSTFFIQQCSATSTNSIIGVVSDNPGFILGGYDVNNKIKGLYPTSFRPVALGGRVPVNVSLANGPIKAGDYLTSSAIPGVAVKALEPGKAVGMALQSFDGTSPSFQGGAGGGQITTGTIKMFVNTSWAPGSPVVLTEADVMPDFATVILDNFTLAIKNSLRKLGLLIKDGVATVKTLFADKVTTQQLCVGNTCVNEQQLQDILSKTQTQAASPNSNGSSSGGSAVLDLQSPPAPVIPTTTSTVDSGNSTTTSTVTVTSTPTVIPTVVEESLSPTTTVDTTTTTTP